MNSDSVFVQNAFIQNLFVDTLGLTKLPQFLPIILSSCAFFWLIATLGSHYITPLFCPKTYSAYANSRKNRVIWAGRVTSQVHALIIVVMAYRSIQADIDPAFGWDEFSGYTNAVACGYFLWDTFDAIFNFVDIGFVLHGFACLMIYSMSFRPFVLYFGGRCLMWELSTLPLNTRWFLLKMISHSKKPSPLLKNCEKIASGTLLLTFFGVRLVWGGFISLHFWRVFLSARHAIPPPYYLIAVGNILLNGLNWLWFSKMFRSAICALRPPKKAVLSNGNGNVVEKKTN